MTTTQKKQSKIRKRHSQEYKAEALALAERVGVPAAAKQLGLHESQLYSWRGKARLNQARGEAEEKLAIENARLKRQLAEQAEELAILKKAAAYFAKSLK
jgi:transposase